MLGILAQSYMIASRSDAPRLPAEPRRRWLARDLPRLRLRSEADD